MRGFFNLIIEIARITIDPERAAAFEAAVAEAATYFWAAEGCHSMALDRVIENPALYRLLVQWETVEHHMVTFRQSEGFQRWRELASPFFVEPPVVVHSEEVGRYF